MPRITLQSIADEVGVSRMTVSNAYSRPDQLSEGLRLRIMAVAQRLGYPGPDPSARSLARGETGMVGVLWPGALTSALKEAGTAAFLGVLGDELAASGQSLTLLPGCAEGATAAAREAAMDATVICAAETEMPDVEWLRQRQLPLVAVDTTKVEPQQAAQAVAQAVREEIARRRETGAQFGLRRVPAPEATQAPESSTTPALV